MKGSSPNNPRSRLTVVESTSPPVRSTHRLSSLLEAISTYKVLVVGDGIFDEYVYVKPQGKSPKENIITNKILRSEKFRGGVWAAARHVESFCGEVTILAGPKAVNKKRYVEDGYIRKLFEVHQEELIDRSPEPAYSAYDLVVVADFGHGAITDGQIEAMIRSSRFLAVNAQTNSANLGFNLITKYRHADYVVIDELEARLAAHDRDSPIEKIIEKLGFKKIVVTLGPHGAIGYDRKFYRASGRTKQVMDTMGAGDAFFCVTAPFACAGAAMDELLEIGNAAGAIKCGIVGHRSPVDKGSLMGYLNI